MNIFGRKKNTPLDGALLALAEALKALAFETREHTKLLRQVMIAQTTIDKTLTDLTTTVAAAVAALPNTVPSTPDNVVQAFVDGVNVQIAALAAGLPAPAPTALPAPAA